MWSVESNFRKNDHFSNFLDYISIFAKLLSHARDQKNVFKRSRLCLSSFFFRVDKRFSFPKGLDWTPWHLVPFSSVQFVSVRFTTNSTPSNRLIVVKFSTYRVSSLNELSLCFIGHLSVLEISM